MAICTKWQELSDPLKLDDSGEQEWGYNCHGPGFTSAWKSGTGGDIDLVCPRTTVHIVKILVDKYP